MKLSLIITTYNRHLMLQRVLEGVQHQTTIPHEVIIADDGSGQDTADLIHAFQAKFPTHLIHVWQENKGFRAAAIRNKAIRISSGDYLVLLDGDCIPTKYFIEDHIKLAQPSFFVQGKRVLVEQKLSESFSFQDMNSFISLLKHIITGQLSNGHHIIRLPAFPAFISKRLTGIRSCNMGFFRKDIYAVNGFNEDFIGWGREDSELAVRFFKLGLKKKEHPFMAICFHLWHKGYDRQSLTKNDELLKKAMISNEYTCKNGLVSNNCTG